MCCKPAASLSCVSLLGLSCGVCHSLAMGATDMTLVKAPKEAYEALAEKGRDSSASGGREVFGGSEGSRVVGIVF